MQGSLLWYIAQCLVAYVIVGIAVYFLDRKAIVPTWRWLYDLAHTHPLPPSRFKGLLYGQKTQWRVTTAFIISTTQSIYMVWYGKVDPLVELPMWLLEVPAMLLGFTLGYPLHQLYLRRTKVYDTIDNLDVDKLGEDALKRFDRAPVRTMEFLRSIGLAGQAWWIEMTLFFRRRRNLHAETPSPTAPAPVSGPLRAAPETVQSAPEPDPMDVIRSYVNRSR